MELKENLSRSLNGVESHSTSNLLRPSDALVQNVRLTHTAVTDVSKGRNRAEHVHAFKIGSIGLLLPKNTVSELVEKLAVCKIPNSDSSLYGVCSLRGAIIPVFNLQKVFGFTETAHSYFLIIGTGEQSVAVLLDSLPQQMNFGENDKFNNIPPLPEALRPFAKVAYKNEGLWIDWSLFEFFKSLKMKHTNE